MTITAIWTLICLIFLDVAIGVGFSYPRDNHKEPGSLQRYFDYGRSIDGKLSRSIGKTAADDAPIIAAGWLSRECTTPIAAAPSGRLGVSFYGMSFSNNIATEIGKVDPDIAITTRAGPGAPVNHSYACFRLMHDANRDPNPVQVIGVLASSLNRLLTLSGTTTSFEAPSPFSYPRYSLKPNGGIGALLPVINDPEQLRNPQLYQAFMSQLSRQDAFYDPWLIDGGWTDRSVFLRLIRRAYAQHFSGERANSLIGNADNPNPEVTKLLAALLIDFAQRARHQGQKPLVILIQDKPDVDRLFRMLAQPLRRAGVPFVSTHDIAPTTNPANFIADGHFSEPANRRIAAVTLQALRREAAKAGQ